LSKTLLASLSCLFVILMASGYVNVATTAVTPGHQTTDVPPTVSSALLPYPPYPYYPCYYGWYNPYCYYYYVPPTVETPEMFQLNIASSPSGIVSVTGGGTYSEGTVASFSIASTIIPRGPGQRYVFSHWSGDFSGSVPAGSVTMNSGKTIIANYELENYLKVSVDPTAVTAVSGSGWHSSTESVSLGPVPAMIAAGNNARYLFEHWTIDGSRVSGTSVYVETNIPHTVVAHYGTQYRLTILSDYGVTTGEGWYDAGSDATLSVTTQVEGSFGVKQVFDRWTGDIQSPYPTETVLMNSPLTVRALWRTDSTVLYAAMAAGVSGVLVLAVLLVALVLMRRTGTEPTPVAPVEAVGVVETVPGKTERPHTTKKKAKPPPKTKDSEPAS